MIWSHKVISYFRDHLYPIHPRFKSFSFGSTSPAGIFVPVPLFVKAEKDCGISEQPHSALVSIGTSGISEKKTPVLHPSDANRLLEEEMRQLDELRSTCHSVFSQKGDFISGESAFLVATLEHCAEVSQVKKTKNIL